MLQISKERFALGSYQYLRYPFEYFLDTAVLLGMQNVELWAAGPSFCLDTMDEAQMKEKAAQIRSREISVCCITPEQCQYPVNLAAEDEKIREYSIRNFERAFYAAEILNCPKVLVSAGCGYFNKPVEDAWKRSEESLYRLSEKAQKMGAGDIDTSVFERTEHAGAAERDDFPYAFRKHEAYAGYRTNGLYGPEDRTLLSSWNRIITYSSP